jgi:hypothetical protein
LAGAGRGVVHQIAFTYAVYVEKVRTQFLSLRQLGRSRLFSAPDCRQ